ncbi:hypothetical protein AAG747_27130 [Rapidithrix thailandica]|uniref:DUF3857 domain-containing protein n=1 Tax=Rapidithrix thailandica TaxID=413964 RepID=A0AAW9SCR4_9BACT
MNKKYYPRSILFLFVTLLYSGWSQASGIGYTEDGKRAAELKQLMWQSGDPDFDVTEVPEKWANKSAVIIAKSNNLSYRKGAMVSRLYFNRAIHTRIKLQDQSALEEYAQFGIPENYMYRNTEYSYYAGFKVIKPSGKEIEIPLGSAVKEERQVNQKGFNKLKLAIPNLELGDILDYYIAEEQTIYLNQSKYYSFDPVIFQLHDDYPVIKQKISFDVLRRCFINLKSLNGAPDFQLSEDAKDDKNHYSLEDGNRESTKDIRWFYPNRALPTIKFKVTYASGMAATATSSFIGEPGKLKSEVSEVEIKNFLRYMIKNASYNYSSLPFLMRDRFKKEDPLTRAQQAYYVYRCFEHVENSEVALLNEGNPNPAKGSFMGMIKISDYYKEQKIPHEILIAVPRFISGIDELILENELSYLLKVNVGDSPFYISRFTNHSTIGEIDENLQGVEAYFLDGLVKDKKWELKKVEIPVSSHEENRTEAQYTLEITDLNEGKIKIAVLKATIGANRVYDQNVLMDEYDYIEEERKAYKLADKIASMKKKEMKKYLELRESYKANRQEKLYERLKIYMENNFPLTIEEVSDFKIENTGRFHDKPDFTYACNVETSGGIKKVGPNYLLDIGKFIEGQVELQQKELDRKYDVYMPYARSFAYTVELKIPEGYKVQGLEKLKVAVENETGGFTSKAQIQGDRLVITTEKYYSSNFVKQEKWPLMVEFLKAASDFNKLQILLKRT